VKYDLDVNHLDVKTAFLNGELQEEIFMSQPEGYVEKGIETKVCLLNKVVYGLKQSARAWNQRLHNVLIELGLSQFRYEPCVYFSVHEDAVTIIAVYVDDLFVFCSNKTVKDLLKTNLTCKFQMKDLGAVSYCLGIKIVRDRENGTLKLSQEEYVKQVLKKFGMEDSKAVSTPLEANHNLQGNVNGTTVELPYQNLIGCLMFLAICSRPDICYSVSKLSQFNTCYDDKHLKAAKRVLRYLQDTADYGITYKRSNDGCVRYVY
jgi:hypothetical protein